MLLNKKIMTTIALLLAIAFQNGHAAITLPKNVDAKKISINYDFHDVLFKSSYKAPAMCLMTALVGSSVLGGYLFGWKGTIGFPTAILATIAIIATRVISNIKQQEYRLEEKAFESDPLLKWLLPIYIQLESFFKPNEKMFNLVKNVNELGIKQMIASNINEGSLNLLKKRHKDSGIFNYFSDILSPTEKNGLLNKRKNKGKDFFTTLADMNKDYDLIVYIDDKKSNCLLAQTYFEKNYSNKKFVFFVFKGDENELEKFIQNTLDEYSNTLIESA